jgi:hypothetical protein
MGRIPFFHRLLAALEIQALSCFIWLSASGPRSWPRLAALAIVAAASLLGFTSLASRGLARRTGEKRAGEAAALIVALSPLVLLDLVFAQFLVVLRDIRPVLLPVTLAAAAILIADLWLRRKALHTELVPGQLRRFGGKLIAEPRKAFRLLVISAFVIYSVLASGAIVPPQPFTGDEPHYLLITKSLLSDGDIDVYNNYRSEDSLDFYPGPLDTHAFPGRRGPEHTYSRHLPGISVLLVPAYAAGELAGKILTGSPARTDKRRAVLVFASRLPIALMAAFLAGFLFLLVLEITGKPGPSLLAWLMFSFASPLVFYSQLIYPEIPVALIGLLIVRNVVLKKDPPGKALVFAGIGIALIPWFGIKYVVVAGTLAALGLLSIFSPHAPRDAWKRAFRLLAGPLISGSAFTLFFWDLYGKVSPLMPYTGSQPTALRGLPPKLHAGILGTLRYGVGFLFDQRYGVFPYAPVLILCIAGAIILFRTRRRTAVRLLGLFAPYGALLSLAQVWGGYCPPGRLLLPVVWVLAVFMGVALAEERGRLGGLALAGLVTLSFLGTLAGLKNAALLYNEHYFMAPEARLVFGRLPEALSNSFVDLKNWIPSFSSWAVLRMPALYAWLTLAGILTGIFGRRHKPASGEPRRTKPGAVRAIVFGAALLTIAITFFNARLGTPLSIPNSDLMIYAQDDHNFGMEDGGFWTKKGSETCVLVRSPKKLGKLKVTLMSPVRGTTRVLAGMFGASAERAEMGGLPKMVEFRRLAGFPSKGGWLYSLRVRDSSGFQPNRLDRNSTDGRALGVFVAVSGELP